MKKGKQSTTKPIKISLELQVKQQAQTQSLVSYSQERNSCFSQKSCQKLKIIKQKVNQGLLKGFRDQTNHIQTKSQEQTKDGLSKMKKKKIKLVSLSTQTFSEVDDCLFLADSNLNKSLNPQATESIKKVVGKQRKNYLKTQAQIPLRKYSSTSKIRLNSKNRNSEVSKQKQIKRLFPAKRKEDSYKKENQAKCDKKLVQRLEKTKQFKFIQQYLTDLELQAIFLDLDFKKIPESRWSIIIVDKVYQIIRRRDFKAAYSKQLRSL